MANGSRLDCSEVVAVQPWSNRHNIGCRPNIHSFWDEPRHFFQMTDPRSGWCEPWSEIFAQYMYIMYDPYNGIVNVPYIYWILMRSTDVQPIILLNYQNLFRCQPCVGAISVPMLHDHESKTKSHVLPSCKIVVRTSPAYDCFESLSDALGFRILQGRPTTKTIIFNVPKQRSTPAQAQSSWQCRYSADHWLEAAEPGKVHDRLWFRFWTQMTSYPSLARTAAAITKHDAPASS